MKRSAAIAVVLLLVFAALPCFADGFNIGNASNFAILYEGNGGHTLQTTNVTLYGNVGVGSTGHMTDSGPSTFYAAGSTVPGSGTVYFSAANTGQFSNNNAANQFSGPVFNSSMVTDALSTVNALNSALGGIAGTSITIHNNTTINASSGMLSTLPACLNCRIFTLTSFNTTNSNIVTINGAASDYVVINIGFSVNFNNQVTLTGGITEDHVLWNFVGGTNLNGGPTLQINTNASSYPSLAAQGIFLDPNGAISLTNANITGRVFGGGTHDLQYVSGTTVDAPPAVPEPAALILFGTGVLAVGSASRRKFRS